MKVVFIILTCGLPFFKTSYGAYICETGWILRSHLCYKLSPPNFLYHNSQLLNNNSATQYCEPNAEIVLPRSPADTTAIREVLQFENEYFWLNIQYESRTGKWIDGDKKPVTYQNWKSPNKAKFPHGKNCAMTNRNGRWEVIECYTFKRVLCSKQATFLIDHCSPNPCEIGECREVKNQKCPNDSFTCVCPDGFEGCTCKLIDDPCVKDPTAKCKKGGTCKVKEQPGKNDWFCLCPGELKRGQAKDCSDGKSEEQKLEESRQTMMKYIVGVPSGAIAIVWVVCCICECAEIGELTDVDMASESPTTSSSGGGDIETAEKSDQNGRASERNTQEINGNGKCEAPTKNGTVKPDSHSDDTSSDGRTKDISKNGKGEASTNNGTVKPRSHSDVKFFDVRKFINRASLGNLEKSKPGQIKTKKTFKELASKIKEENKDVNDEKVEIKKAVSMSTKSENNTDDEEIQNDKRHILNDEHLDQVYLKSLAKKNEKNTATSLSDSIDKSEDENNLKHYEMRSSLHSDKQRDVSQISKAKEKWMKKGSRKRATLQE